MCTKFYCRACKADKNGFAPIEVSLTINGKRTFIQLPRKERATDFKKAVESKRTNDIKEYLEAMRVNINKAITEIAKAGKPLTAMELKEYVKNGGFKVYTIGELFSDHFALIKGTTSLEPYKLVRDAFFNHISPNASVDQITNAVIQSFVNKLYKAHKVNTAYGKVVKLKSTISYGLANHKLSYDPFIGVKYSRVKEKIEYLTERELAIIASSDFGDRLNKVRDLFLFQAGSGLAYADMASLVPEDIQVKDGTYYIQKNRVKTNVEYTAILLPNAVEVLTKYNYCLPVISNAKLNEYLKELQGLCKMAKRLHSHLARKTYCTHLLNNGVRMDIVSKCAGHSSIRTTEAVYGQLLKETIISEVGRII
jgi:integrase